MAPDQPPPSEAKQSPRTATSNVTTAHVMDPLIKHQKSVSFDDKAKVGALVQRANAFKKKKLEEQAEEDQGTEEQALAHARWSGQLDLEGSRRRIPAGSWKGSGRF
ncbi:hypothetical protein V8E53_002106 [Lactarius tabidus]